MVSEVLEALAPAPGETFVDCTAGLGGHAAAVARRLGSAGTVVLCELDAENLERAAARVRQVEQPPAVVTVHGSFAAIGHEMARAGLKADSVLADLGFASTQVDDAARGFSFSADGPLDMRLNRRTGPTAADLVNSLPEGDLAQIIRDYGEERHAGLVARRIVEMRTAARIETTGQLAQIVRGVVRRSPGGIDPATRTFQAIRMAVNDEMGNLDGLLAAMGAGLGSRPAWLNAGARVAVISFHSLEDRAVKRAFAAMTARGMALDSGRGVGRPTEGEVRMNPRSASAKLRSVVMTAGG